MIGETQTFGQTFRNLRQRAGEHLEPAGHTTLALHLLDPSIVPPPVDMYDWLEGNPDALPPCTTETE